MPKRYKRCFIGWDHTNLDPKNSGTRPQSLGFIQRSDYKPNKNHGRTKRENGFHRQAFADA